MPLRLLSLHHGIWIFFCLVRKSGNHRVGTAFDPKRTLAWRGRERSRIDQANLFATLLFSSC
jgi:hypothetical protein